MTFESTGLNDGDETDDDSTDTGPSPIARFKRYLAARKTARLGHRDTDTDETERLKP